MSERIAWWRAPTNDESLQCIVVFAQEMFDTASSNESFRDKAVVLVQSLDGGHLREAYDEAVKELVQTPAQPVNGQPVEALLQVSGVCVVFRVDGKLCCFLRGQCGTMSLLVPSEGLLFLFQSVEAWPKQCGLPAELQSETFLKPVSSFATAGNAELASAETMVQAVSPKLLSPISEPHFNEHENATSSHQDDQTDEVFQLRTWNGSKLRHRDIPWLRERTDDPVAICIRTKRGSDGKIGYLQLTDGRYITPSASRSQLAVVPALPSEDEWFSVDINSDKTVFLTTQGRGTHYLKAVEEQSLSLVIDSVNETKFALLEVEPSATSNSIPADTIHCPEWHQQLTSARQNHKLASDRLIATVDLFQDRERHLREIEKRTSMCARTTTEMLQEQLLQIVAQQKVVAMLRERKQQAEQEWPRERAEELLQLKTTLEHRRQEYESLRRKANAIRTAATAQI